MPTHMRRVLFTLCAVAAGLGLWLGTRAAPLDESAAIVATIDRYVAETGDAPTDCVAVTGQGVWLEVLCTGARYEVTRRGTITRLGPVL